MTIGINTSPLAGTDGNKLTARQILSRLDAELVGNVSLRVKPTERPDTWEVQGRGELQLAVLVETMRREGFELTVGKPQVVTREIDGKLHEPMERVAIDVPDDYLGVVTQLMALRKGTPHRDGQPRHRLGAHGLPGPGPGPGRLPHRVHDRDPGHRHAPPRLRRLGALARRAQDQAQRLDGGRPARHHHRLHPDEPAGAGHPPRRARVPRSTRAWWSGENARDDEMDVNPTKEKKQTNVRSAAADEAIRLTPPLLLSLEQALEFIADDECVEVTPERSGCARSSSTRPSGAASAAGPARRRVRGPATLRGTTARRPEPVSSEFDPATDPCLRGGAHLHGWYGGPSRPSTARQGPASCKSRSAPTAQRRGRRTRSANSSVRRSI